MRCTTARFLNTDLRKEFLQSFDVRRGRSSCGEKVRLFAMKKIKLYQCKFCKKVYKTEGNAQKCEKSHCYPDEIDTFIYDELADCTEEIIVKMMNGKLVKYRMCDI